MHLILELRQPHRRVTHFDAQLQPTMCSIVVGTGGTVLSSAIKCSAEACHQYSSTKGIMGWGCKTFCQIWRLSCVVVVDQVFKHKINIKRLLSTQKSSLCVRCARGHDVYRGLIMIIVTLSAILAAILFFNFESLYPNRVRTTA